MFAPSRQLALFFQLPTLVVSLALNAPQNPNSPTALTNPSSLAPTWNTTLLRSNVSALRDVIMVDCDESRLGNPPSASCEEAVAQLPHDTRSILTDPNRSYGPRGKGTWDVNLPKRYIGSDGLCVVEFTQSSYPSHVRNNEILASGNLILSECVDEDTGEPPWGGQAVDMADERNFQVTIRAYEPPFVRCQDTVPASRPSSKACATILDTMNASARQTTFGARGVADVDEYLPQLLTDPSGRCSINIDIVAPDDAASWYDLWQAAVALDGMCAQGGKQGKSRFLGANRRIQMQIQK